MKALISLVVGILFAGALVAFSINDEVRLGRLNGSVVMTENSKTLPGATVALYRLNEPTGTYFLHETLETNGEGRFDFGTLPAGAYSISAYSKAHTAAETKFSVREGETTDYIVNAKPGEPYLRVFAAKHVFLPNAEPQLTIEGFGQDPDLTITLFKVDFNKVVAGGGLESVLRTAWRWDDGIRTEDPTVYKTLKTETRPIERRDVEGAYVESVNLDSLPSGMYWVSGKAGASLRSGTYILVSKIALVTKRVGKEVRAFVADMDTGRAISGASFSVFSGATSVAKAKTHATGLATVSVPEGTNGNVAAVASFGNERAVVPIYMYAESDSGIRTSIVTDRPVYRPGHTVHYKGIVRRLDGSKYVVPASTPVQVDIQDADAISLKTETLTTDEFGGFSGSFDINSEAATGYFSIEATVLGSRSTEEVQVAAYRKPDFEIDVSTVKPYYVRGERIAGSVDVRYYFGGAVPEAKVDVSVYRRPHYGEYEEYFRDYEAGDSGEYIGDLTAVTDGQGKARFTYETASINDPESDYVYTFEAAVTDDSGRYFQGSGTVRVTRGEFEVIAIPETYVVDQGAEASIRVEASSFDGKPIDTTLTVVYGVETWSGNDVKLRETGRTTVQTQNGTAVISAKAQHAGYMVFQVTATDDRGNKIMSRPGVYVPGSGEWGATSRSVSVKMDRTKYKIGDNAQAVIVAPVAGDAWITLEGKQIYESRIVRLEKGGNLVDFKVTEQMLPNSYVSVQYVNAATFYEGTTELSVDQASQKMTIEVKADRADYQPGETATFTIKATNAAGKPVVADLAFGLVDESIYAIREDRKDLLSEFYPMRYSSIYTAHSFQEIFLGDGDKDSVQFDVRRRFLDTAYWQPTVVTNSNGEATVTAVLPDNLTTWRATVRGLSAVDSLVGQGVAKIVVAKPLMARLTLPRFLVQSDEVEISATINSSHNTMDAAVTLDAVGVELLDAPRRSVSVSPSSPQTVRWRIRATDPGSATFKVTAVSGAPNVSDAMETSIPVIAKGRLIDGYEVGEAQGRKSLKVELGGIIAGSGELEITLASNLFDTLTGSFDYLANYPYGCVEQTVSSFVPTLIISKSPLARTLSPQVRAELPQMIADGFTRLRALQDSDGGWGWFGTAGVNAYMTGLVLESYGLAAAAGHSANAESRSRAVEWAQGWLNSADRANDTDFSDRLWIIRGLSAVGATQVAADALSATNLQKLSADDWACVAIAAHRVGNTGLATTAVAELKKLATVSATHAQWKSEWYGYSTSAQATLAFATVAPNDPIVVKAARFLLDSRRGNHWVSTQDTAFAILALSKVQQGATQTEPQMIKVISGNETLELVTISPGNPEKLVIKMDRLTSGCVIEVDSGKAYFTANWRYRVNDQKVSTGERGDGLSVTREYYELKPRRLDNGTLRLLPSGSPVRRISAGDTVRAVVKINSSRSRSYMMLEDPIPSGFEVLERSSDGMQAWEWFYWYSGLDIRDDRIVYFIEYLPEGEEVIEYTLRAESPGKATALPAVVSGMYEPDDSAYTGARTLEVTK
ncbi:MAG: MG2 domain-containing protein [Fimbriimonadales bacterium]